MVYKLGSLFDGSGGFPLAGSLCGIEPVWAAEVEPYPIAVTRSRFPTMKHLGDISKVNGAEIEPVDIITFGSPCQDLSVAGKRAGLKHEANGDEETTRSGLFMEAVRIIKEMRSATNGEYPTFALWENVPGAFSSNKGEDFRIVCEELIKIVEPSASMPEVPKNGWPYADSYCGDGWSLAYRVFDAQYWGVPQRRRRIHLVLDLRGERAREVLFEREGVRGYFAQGRTPWKTAPGDAQDRTGADDRVGESARGLDAVSGGFCPEQSAKTRGIGWEEETAPTPRAGVVPGVAYSFDSLASNSMKSSNPHSGCRQVEIAKCLDTTDPNPSKNQGGIAIVEPIPYTLKIRSGCEGGGKGALVQVDKSATLATNNDQYLFQPVGILASSAVNAETTDGSISPCLMARAGTGGNQLPLIAIAKPICLQGGGNNTPFVVEGTIPIHDKATRYKGGGPTRNGDGAGNGLGVGKTGDPAPTLSTCERHAVAYLASGKKVVGTLQAGPGERGFYSAQELFSGNYHIVEEHPCVFRQGGFADYVEGEVGTLRAAGGDYGGGTENLLVEKPAVRYIVRRLTPTECARLQGFADRWGDIDEKDNFTPEEYNFWQEVRTTHAAINGKRVQEYTEQQMLTWYNKLHTDSAEYKMWGNGIALPPALYCMQGMAEALESADAEDWML